MLDVRRLQILRAVVASGSVGAAAANLGYTSSAISQQLATLEREAGTQLLEKSGRGVRPTAAGTLLAERAGTVADVLSRTERELADLRAGRTGTLRVLSFSSAAAGLLPPAVVTFRAEHPEVRVEIRRTETGMLEELAQGEADLALFVVGRLMPQAQGARLLHLVDDPYWVVLPQEHPLAERAEIELAELCDEDWVDDGDLTGPCRETVEEAYAAAGFEPRLSVQADGGDAVRGFVRAGMGVAMIPRLTADRVPEGTVARPLCTGPVRHIYLGVRETIADQTVVTGFLRALEKAAGPRERVP